MRSSTDCAKGSASATCRRQYFAASSHSMHASQNQPGKALACMMRVCAHTHACIRPAPLPETSAEQTSTRLRVAGVPSALDSQRVAGHSCRSFSGRGSPEGVVGGKASRSAAAASTGGLARGVLRRTRAQCKGSGQGARGSAPPRPVSLARSSRACAPASAPGGTVQAPGKRALLGRT